MTKGLAAVVLAGGQATRMGGGQKTLLALRGRALLEHVLARLRPQASEIAINANGDLSGYEGFDLPVLSDRITGFPGPLAGILEGLHWARARGHDRVLAVAGDTPFFPPDLAARLSDVDAPVVLAASKDPARGLLRQPTFGLWRTDLAQDLEAAIIAGTRKIVAFTSAHGGEAVGFDTAPFDPFFNVNSPADMLAAEKILAEHGL